MPLLIWDPFDLVAVLGVLPSHDEFETSHQYLVEQGSLRLELTIWQYDSDIEIQIWETSLPKPIIKFTLLGCPGIRVIDDKRGTFLEFAASNTFTGRYDGYSVIPYGLRLWVEPQFFWSRLVMGLYRKAGNKTTDLFLVLPRLLSSSSQPTC